MNPLPSKLQKSCKHHLVINMCILSKNGAVSKCKTPSLIGVFKISRGKKSYTQLVGDCCRITDELRLPRTPWNYIIRILPNVSYPKTPKNTKNTGPVPAGCTQRSLSGSWVCCLQACPRLSAPSPRQGCPHPPARPPQFLYWSHW